MLFTPTGIFHDRLPALLSLENYIGRRLLALLAALAIADIVILFSISMNILLSGMGGGTQEIVRTRAI